MEALHAKYQQEMEDGQQRMRSMLQAKAQEVKEVQELLESAQVRLADEMEQAALQKAALAAAPQKLRQKLGALVPGMLPAPPNTPAEGGRFLLPKDGMDTLRERKDAIVSSPSSSSLSTTRGRR